MERKSQLKTITVHLLFSSRFPLVAPFFFFRVLDGCDDKDLASPSQQWRDVSDAGAPSATPQLLWGLAGDQVTTCCPPAPPRPVWPLVCLGLVTLLEVKFRVRPVGSPQKEVSRILSVALEPADGFLSQQRAVMDLNPPLYEVLKPFLMDYLLLHLHLLYRYLFFSPPSRFHFINVFYFSRFSLVSSGSPPFSLLLLFCFGVVWIAPALCLKSWVQCLQVEFQSLSSPQFWSDGVCVFIKILLLLNVLSVAVVQGKCWRQCNCNKCSNLSWIFCFFKHTWRRSFWWYVCTMYVVLSECLHQGEFLRMAVKAFFFCHFNRIRFSPHRELSSSSFLRLPFLLPPAHNAPCLNTSDRNG